MLSGDLAAVDISRRDEKQTFVEVGWLDGRQIFLEQPQSHLDRALQQAFETDVLTPSRNRLISTGEAASNALWLPFATPLSRRHQNGSD